MGCVGGSDKKKPEDKGNKGNTEQNGKDNAGAPQTQDAGKQEPVSTSINRREKRFS